MDETDVFISYKREEKHFALELKSRLEAKKYVVWMDEYIPYGREWRKEIDKHLEDTLLVVVITSPASMRSAYVTYEWCYACRTLGKDFHWIEIADCPPDDGMYGLLTDKRQRPLKCNSAMPTDDEWRKVISSVESRLIGIKGIRRAGEILINRKKPQPQQTKAAQRLGRVKNPFHQPLARKYLLAGLRVHTRTTGLVSGPIVEALWNLGDISAIPYLIQFLDTEDGHENEIDDSAKALLKTLVGQNIDGN